VLKVRDVLITAVWEAYCEDIVAEGLKHLVANASSNAALPKALRKQIVKELGAEADELAVWQLADAGWRTVLEARIDRLAEERNRRLNTPKTGKINELFLTELGIPKISATWNWTGMTKASAEAKLDRFVELRGTITHRGGGSGKVRKTQVKAYYGHVTRLVGKTGGRVNRAVEDATGSGLW